MNNKKEGKGKMKWYDRSEEYEGNWTCDLPDGYGEHYWLCETSGKILMRNHYKGEWKQGKREGKPEQIKLGFGVFYYADGSRYEGYWYFYYKDRHNNLKEGANIYFFDNGQIVVNRIKNDNFIDIPEINQVKTRMIFQFPVYYIDDLINKSDVKEVKLINNLLLRQLEYIIV